MKYLEIIAVSLVAGGVAGHYAAKAVVAEFDKVVSDAKALLKKL
jgi:hypothetical protein